ncbi:MAG: PLP-dependent aminotransferase family protein, partial [Acidobacteriaceae bacterium]|nr:PLP-dependent aminotransferase family protein [Acidobacteriaceae bacterium]
MSNFGAHRGTVGRPPRTPNWRKPRGGMSPLIAVDRNSSKPIHRQIYDAYRAAILGRNLPAGQQVPSTRALAHELGVSRIPVVDAYAQLFAEGYFETRPGAGTFVSSSLHSSLEAERGESTGESPELASERPRPRSRRVALLSRREDSPWAYGSGAFSVAQLAFDQFPLQVWSKLVSRRARSVRASSLHYGDPMGSRELREVLAAYLRTARSVHCDPERIMIVSGSQQGLDLCGRVLFDPGDAAWVEEPGYALMHSALSLVGCRLIPVPVDKEGIDVSQGVARCPDARAAYVTPSHQCPMGVTMTVSRRLQLLDWANNAGAWILEDDYDSEYRFDSSP